MSKSVVFVIGASGNVGTATVQALSSKYADKVEIRAGVRNPDKAEKLKIPNVTIVKAEMGSGDALVDTLKGVDALYIVTPPVEKPVEMVVSTAKSAKAAGVKFILVVSVVSGVTAGLTDNTIGEKFSQFESEISKLGVSHTVLRLPMFVENFWGMRDSIQGQSTIYHPQDPEMPFAMIVVADIGKVSAAILVNSSAHVGKMYKLIGDTRSMGDVTKYFSSALGREVKYVRMAYEAAKKSFMDMGVPEWQVDRLFAIYQLVDSGSLTVNAADLLTYKEITGEDPTDLKTWIQQYGAAFK